MKKIYTCTLFLMLATLGLSTVGHGQQTLELFNNGMSTTAQGPVVTTPAITCALNTDNPTGSTNTTSYGTPPVTVTYSLDNQQYGTSTADYSALFGYTNAANPIYVKMSTFGSPTADMFTSGLESGKGFDMDKNYTVQLLVRGNAALSPSGGGGTATNAKVRIADLTITFSQSVSNPILHLGGSGGQVPSSSGSTLGISTEFDLVGINGGSTSGYSFTRLSGNYSFNVNGLSITNSATTYTATSVNSGPSGMSGSVRVNGNSITSVKIRLYLHGDGNADPSLWSSAGDGLDLGVSLPYGQYAINGTVRNDPNTADGINGPAYNYASAPPLYAYLVNGSNKIVGMSPVTEGGYSFGNVSYPSGGGSGYSIVLNTNGNLAVDGTVTAVSAYPTSWIYKGAVSYNANASTSTITTGNAAVTNLPSPTTMGFGSLTEYPNIDIALYNSIALPVHYAKELTAVWDGKGVLLNWTTAQELNNKQFVVYRSTDSKNWNSVGVVKSFFADGNSNTGYSYSFTDNNTPEGSVYYYLKQMDKDGKTDNSCVVSIVTGTAATASITLYPVPVNNTLYVAQAQSGSQYRILSVNGKALQAATIQNDPQLINVGVLPAGVYFIQIIDKQSKVTVLKFIKK